MLCFMCCPSLLKGEQLQNDFHSSYLYRTPPNVPLYNPLVSLFKTGSTDTWCTADCSVYKRGHGATYGQCVKIHTAPAVAAKNVLWLSVHTGIK